MRVLVLSQYFWPESFRINEVVKSLHCADCHITVLTGQPNYPQGEVFDGYSAVGFGVQQHEAGYSIYRVPLVPRGHGGARGLVVNYLSFVLSASLLAPWLLRKQRFDVIFVYAPSPIIQAIPAVWLAFIKRAKLVTWVQDLWPQSLEATGFVRNRPVLAMVAVLVRWIYRRCDLLLVQSRAFEAPVRLLAGDTPIVYYPNSVDEIFAISAQHAAPDVAGLGLGFTVMFAGNIGSAQAVEVIVEAAALLQAYSDIHFVVLGEGSRWAWMKQQAAQRGLDNLHLPGRFPVETMPGFMQKASALLVTLADQPIFAATVPNKIQAYMAAGRPIIACINGEGARLVVEASAGLATPAEDAAALAETILRLYRLSSGERNEMGENGRGYYQKHFQHDRLVDQLIGHLQHVSRNGKDIQ